MKNIKKLLSVVLILVMVLTAAPLGGFIDLEWGITASALEASGKIGDNLTYTFDETTGEVVVSGTGPMTDFHKDSPMEGKAIKHIVIEEGVTSIGSYAFSSCRELVSLTIADSVTSIGRYAFYFCDSLVDVELSQNLIDIGEEAFSCCYSLTNITIPDSVTIINVGVFSGCSDLKSISIPYSVKTILKYAFYECYNLTDVHYGGTEDDWNSISIDIGNDYLLEAKSPTQDSGSDYLTSGYCGDPDEGDTKNIYWELDRKGILTITGTGKIAPEAFNYDLRIKEVIISDGITNIPSYCFNQCENLKKVTMGDDIETIENYAFRQCYNLANVDFSDSLTTIGYEGFRNCNNLRSVKLPDSLKVIENYGFAWCYNLTNIDFPDSLTKIAYGAFTSCNSLTSVVLPESLVRIENDAFNSCNSLKTVEIGSSLEYLSQYAFAWCQNLSEITVSESNKYYASQDGIVYNKEKTNLYFVPAGISGEITIPAAVKIFTYEAVQSCRKLTAIHVEKGNLNYKSVDGIVYTADGKNLIVCPKAKAGSVTIADGTETIGNYAFRDCDSIQSVDFPDSLITIGCEGFSNCDNIRSVKLPDSLKTIESYGFGWCYNLINIDFPESLTKISYGAFLSCNSLTSVVLPESLVRIENDAFSSCNSLKTVEIGSSLEYLSQYAFAWCQNLSEITVSESNKYYASQDGIVYNKEKTNLYIVPAGISGEITIPAAVKIFTYEAVQSCRKLTAIHVEKENLNYKSVDGIVYTADGKNLIVCPKARAGSVTIAEGTETIEHYAFQDCDSIVSVELPDSLITVRYDAFNSCDNLRSMKLPDSIKSIESYAFANNWNLEVINIPKSITRIDNHIFYGCGFYELTLPVTVQSFNHTGWNRLKTFTILNRYCEYTNTEAPSLGGDCTIRAYCGSLGHTFAVKRLLNFESIGHEYLDWYTYQPATFEENGIERRDCAHCDGYDERIIPKIETEIFTATFVADGEVVATVDFPKGKTSIPEPKVPAKDRYMGEWESYTLANADIIINAVYTLIRSEDASEIKPSTEVIHYYDRDDVFFSLKAQADALVVKSTVSTSVPLDIVLVVDQSGSMDETLGGKTKKVDALKETAKDFVNTVCENAKITGADHRISLVGFGLSGKYQGYEKNENTELLTSENGIVKFDDIRTADYASSLLSVNIDGKVNDKLITAIDSIGAHGATAADLGFEMAKGVFANSDSTDRQRVVIFMTDGEPTYSSKFETSVANAAIYNASLLKKVYNASIYSVGVFSDADSKNANINNFMNAVSSGYPNAVSMKQMGNGVDGQYYLTVNNTDSLTSVFKTISTESLSHTAPFDNLTFIKTLSKYVTITSPQEEQLRIDLMRKYGITNDDIIITRNGDGTTTVQINGLSPYETTDKSGNVVYEVSVEFFASLNEHASTPGNYIVDTEDSGVMLGEDAKGYEITFGTNLITLKEYKTRVIFTINGEVYDISSDILDSYAVAPGFKVGDNWEFSGWDTKSQKAYNGLVLDATLRKPDRTIIWHTAYGDIVHYYIAGSVIEVPKVGATDNGEVFLSWDKSIPTTMPDENLEFTAIYGQHVHKYISEISVKMTCETDGIVRYTCSCGDVYEEVVAAVGHNYEAMTPSLEKEDAKCTFCCTNCGDKYEYALNYEVVQVTGNKEKVLYEFSLTDDELNTTVQPDGEIKIRIPLSEIHGNVAKAVVIRTNEDGTTTEVPATVKDGFLVITCSHFTPYEVTFVFPCEIHEEVEWVVTKEATCKEAGVNSAICIECKNVVETEEIKMLDHTESDWLIEAYPICCKDGSKYKACTGCGKILDEEVIERLNPEAAEWIIYKESTCYSEGLEQEICTVCDTILSEKVLPLSNHIKSNWWVIEAEATCKNEGIAHRVCEFCKVILETNITETLAHNKSGWFIYTKPTCTKEGLNAIVCKDCGTILESEPIAKTGHKESEWIVSEEPTCNSQGTRYTYCTVCNQTVSKELLPAIEHKIVWYDDLAPTCAKEGIKHSACTLCKEILDFATIEKLPHTESKWTVTKAPTCAEEGLQQITCTVCKAVVKTESINKLAHSYGKDGVCINCGFKKDHVCQTDGHVFGDKWIMDLEPTCTSEGSKSHQCIYCDKKADVTVIKKLVHTYSSVRIEPTCLKIGYDIYVCLCGDSYYETIPVVEHNFSGSECVDCGFNKADSCSCNCHKSGILVIIWKIINFFNKLLKKNAVCACGKAHY